MGFAEWMRVLDTVGGLVQLTGRFARRDAGGPGGALMSPPASPLGALETRLAGVVVAALKEAFDRDSARLELERGQIDAERRRAEDALRAELRRQAAERSLGQLRLIAIMAISLWALSAALAVLLPGMRVAIPRGLLGAGWICVIGALGMAFASWQHISAWSAETGPGPTMSPQTWTAVAAPWLLIGALALVAASLLTAL
jgi:hypothetical protein